MLEIIRTKLQDVDSNCESEARNQINAFYESAKYNGTRFVVPSFKEVSGVWLALIDHKARQSLEELTKILSHPNAEIGSKNQVEIQKVLEEVFCEYKYINRLERFSDGLKRKAESYGLQFNPTDYQFELHDAAYRVGVKNLIRRARRSLQAELSLHGQQSTPEAVQTILKWLSFIKFKPWQSLAYLVLITFIALLSSIGLSDLIEWYAKSPTP